MQAAEGATKSALTADFSMISQSAITVAGYVKCSKQALADGGKTLVYSYDAKGERTGITALLTALPQAGLRMADLDTEASSLEDIFVGLVHHEAPATHGTAPAAEEAR